MRRWLGALATVLILAALFSYAAPQDPLADFRNDDGTITVPGGQLTPGLQQLLFPEPPPDHTYTFARERFSPYPTLSWVAVRHGAKDGAVVISPATATDPAATGTPRSTPSRVILPSIAAAPSAVPGPPEVASQPPPRPAGDVDDGEIMATQDYFPGTQTAVTGTVSGTFPTDIETSNDVYLTPQEENTGGPGDTTLDPDTDNVVVGTKTGTFPTDLLTDDSAYVQIEEVDQAPAPSDLQVDTQNLVTGTQPLGTFPGDARSSNNVYVTYREADTGGAGGPAETWYARATNDALACGSDLNKDASETQGASVATHVLDGTYDYWYGSDAARTIEAGNWVVTLWTTTGAGGGPPGKVTVIVERIVKATCAVQQLIVSEEITMSAGTTGSYATTPVNPGQVVVASGEQIIYRFAKTNGNRTVTLRYDFNDANTANTRLAHPGTAGSTNYELNIENAWSAETCADTRRLRIEAYHTDTENILVQALTPPSTWTTRITVTATADPNAYQTWDLTVGEWASGSPTVRYLGSAESGDATQTDFVVDHVQVLCVPAADYEMEYRVGWTGPEVCSATRILRVSAHHSDTEDILLQVDDGSEANYVTRITVTATADPSPTYQTYTLTAGEWDLGLPDIRFIGNAEVGDTTQTTLYIDDLEILCDDAEPNYEVEVVYDWTGVDTSGDSWTLVVECKRLANPENLLVQVVDSTEATWTTRYTCDQDIDTTYDTYLLTADELDAGDPNMRVLGASESGDASQSTWNLDLIKIVRSYTGGTTAFLVLGDPECVVTAIGTDPDCWSSTSGGNGDGLPDGTEQCVADANSGAGTGTMDAAITCGTTAMDTTGFTGTFAIAGQVLTLNAGLTHAGGTFTITTGTVAAGANAVTITSAFTSTGACSVTSGAMTIGAGGTLTANACTFTVSGNWNSTAGTFTMGTSTLRFVGTSNFVTPISVNFYNITVAGGASLTFNNQVLRITNVLTVGDTSGATVSATASHFIYLSATVTDPLSLHVDSIFSSTARLIFSSLNVNIPGHDYGDWLLYVIGGAGQTLTGNVTTTNVLFVYNTAVLSLGGFDLTVGSLRVGGLAGGASVGILNAGASSVVVNGLVSVGTLAPASYITSSSLGSWTVSDAWTNASTSASWDFQAPITFTSPTGGTMTFAGTGLAVAEFNNVTFTSSAATAQTFTMATRALRWGGTLTVSDASSTTALATADLGLSTGALVVGNGGIFTANASAVVVASVTMTGGASGVITVTTGDWTASGNWDTSGAGSVYTQGTGSVTIDATATITMLSTDDTFDDLAISVGTSTMASAVAVTNTLTITSTLATADFSLSAETISVVGTLTAGTSDLTWNHLDVDGTMTMDGEAVDDMDIDSDLGTILLTVWTTYSVDAGGVPDIRWTMNPDTAGSDIAFTVAGLTAGGEFSLYRDEVEVATANADGAGLWFVSLAGGWSEHEMRIGAASTGGPPPDSPADVESTIHLECATTVAAISCRIFLDEAVLAIRIVETEWSLDGEFVGLGVVDSPSSFRSESYEFEAFSWTRRAWNVTAHIFLDNNQDFVVHRDAVQDNSLMLVLVFAAVVVAALAAVVAARRAARRSAGAGRRPSGSNYRMEMWNRGRRAK